MWFVCRNKASGRLRKLGWAVNFYDPWPRTGGSGYKL